MVGSEGDGDDFPWVVVAYSLALYNYVLAFGFLLVSGGIPRLTTLFGILGTMSWILGGLVSHVR